MWRIYKAFAEQVSEIVPCTVGDPPDAIRTPYAFVWGALPIADSPLMAPIRVFDHTFHLQVVDVAAVNVLALSARIVERLDGWAPTLSGLHVSALTLYGSEPVQPDRITAEYSTNRYPWYQTLHYRVQAEETNNDAARVGQADGEKAPLPGP